MKRIPYTLKILMPGFLAAQVIAAIQVYVSNRGLYQTLIDLAGAGHLVVPNGHVMPRLLEPGTALAGALFFTLSLGAGLSVLSFAAAWIWERLLSRKKMRLIPFALFWGILIILPNIRGFSPFVSLYLLLIPPLVFFITSKVIPPRTGKRPVLKEMVQVVPLVIIAVLWGASMNEWFFLNVRDTLLLSNPAGSRVNDFYYTYTLYPAEVFKTLQQKTLKTCRIAGVPDAALASSLETTLARFDYLAVDPPARADLTVGERDGTLFFEHEGAVLVKCAPVDFIARPAETLREFSTQSDGNLFFRRITFFSLAAGLPVALYMILYGLCRCALSFFMNAERASLAALLVCLASGTVLVVPFYMQGDEVVPDRVAMTMESPDWRQRVAALRTIDRANLEVGNYPSYRKMIASTHVAERYWIAFVLGKSRRPETYPDIVTLLDDPHPNVVCKAIEALGKRGGDGAIEDLKRRIGTSDHWYVQWYAYRALRSLGWKQTRST
jgi:hypothetical protein